MPDDSPDTMRDPDIGNLVSLSELERKVPTLWEGIKAAYAIGGEE
jgi:hypothetical protein